MNSVSLLQNIELFVFLFLGIVAFYRWYKRRGGVRAWMAATFATLAVVCLVGRFLPQDPNEDAPIWVYQIVITLVVLFPYLLFRFMLSFGRPSRWVYRLANTLTVLAIGSTLLLRNLPKPNEHRTNYYIFFTLTIVVQWLFLLGVVAIRLWRGGSHEGTIARRRMRTLSMGAAGIAAALVMTAINQKGPDNTVLASAAYIVAILSAPLFLLGFAPPAFVVAMWRRQERFRFREAEGGLIEALTPKDVADVLLPLMANYMGGSGALLTDHEGKLIGSYGFSPERAEELPHQIANSASKEIATTSETAAAITIPLHDGWLALEASVFAPYFGKEEMSLLHSLASFTDMALTRARVTESERQLSEELKLKNEEMRDFVAMVSHDLRAPITVIKGFASTIGEDWESTSDNDKRASLAIIDRQAQQLDRLVEDLLTVSKLDANSIKPHPTELSCKEAVDAALMQFGYFDFPLDIKVPASLRAYVDSDHLVRMLHNYLINATNYGRPPFSISAHKKGNKVVFCIKDCGDGIEESLRPRLFERFARGAHSTGTGSGLGLAIVAGLAQAANGAAWFEPNHPHGSCFFVSLPLASSSRVDLTREKAKSSR